MTMIQNIQLQDDLFLFFLMISQWILFLLFSFFIFISTGFPFLSRYHIQKGRIPPAQGKASRICPFVNGERVCVTLVVTRAGPQRSEAKWKVKDNLRRSRWVALRAQYLRDGAGGEAPEKPVRAGTFENAWTLNPAPSEALVSECKVSSYSREK